MNGVKAGRVFLRSSVDAEATAAAAASPALETPSGTDTSDFSARQPSSATTVAPAPPYVWELKRMRTLGKGSFGIASLVEVVSALPPWFPDDLLSASAAPTNLEDTCIGGQQPLDATAQQAELAATAGRPRQRTRLVLKEISLQCCRQADREALFREIAILKSVKHPNVVRYIDSALDADTNRLLILMEYCDGGDLSELIDTANRRAPMQGLTEAEVWALLIQLLMALKSLHFEYRIIHRDMKPQNVFLTSSGIVKVGDFGVSAVLSQSADFVRTFCGSPYYLAPELCEDKPYNGKADLWSLGCVLYELLAYGQRAFKGTTLPGILGDILSGQYTPIDEVVHCLAMGEVQRPSEERAGYGPELRRIVSMLLQRDPDARASLLRLVRLPSIQLRAPQLLQPALLRQREYQEVFTGHLSARAAHQLEAATGTAAWNDVNLEDNASPVLPKRRRRLPPGTQLGPNGEPIGLDGTWTGTDLGSVTSPSNVQLSATGNGASRELRSPIGVVQPPVAAVHGQPPQYAQQPVHATHQMPGPHENLVVVDGEHISSGASSGRSNGEHHHHHKAQRGPAAIGTDIQLAVLGASSNGINAVQQQQQQQGQLDVPPPPQIIASAGSFALTHPRPQSHQQAQSSTPKSRHSPNVGSSAQPPPPQLPPCQQGGGGLLPPPPQHNNLLGAPQQASGGAVSFPKASPMIPVYGSDATPSTSASPHGLQRLPTWARNAMPPTNNPGSQEASPALDALDRQPSQIPLHALPSFVHPQVHIQRGPDNMNDSYAEDIDEFDAEEARRIEDRVYKTWTRTDAVPQSALTLALDEELAPMVRSPTSGRRGVADADLSDDDDMPIFA